MKVVEAKRLYEGSGTLSTEEISSLMDTMESHELSAINWKEFSYRPGVRFAIAYSSGEIFVKYYVHEESSKAEMSESNQNVYEDSCVEFFVSPADDGIYYNFEFNCIGTCLLGSGRSRKDSRRADKAIIGRIRRHSSLGTDPFPVRRGDLRWNLTVAIPFGVFFHHEIKEVKGKTFRANFYKCGDALPVPHYVSWNPIGTPKPDFHRPEFFGELRFI